MEREAVCGATREAVPGREVSSVPVRMYAARVGLLGLAALLLLGGGFGAAGLVHASASGATSGGPSPPPHPNV